MLKVREIMTTEVLTVSPTTTLRDAADLFARRHVSGAPVMDGGTLVGVVSMVDIMAFVTSPAFAEHEVREVMTRDAITIGPDTPVPLAAACLRQAGVHRVLVVDRDVLCGIVTTTDIVRAVADDKLVRRTFVFGHAHDRSPAAPLVMR